MTDILKKECTERFYLIDNGQWTMDNGQWTIDN